MMTPSPNTAPLVTLARAAAASLDGLQFDATLALRRAFTANGKLSADAIERGQHAAHGLAWLATYAQAIRQMAAYAERLSDEGRFGETEELLTRIGLGEYLAQTFGGIPMSQGEIIRLADFGLTPTQIAARRTPEVETLMAQGNSVENRANLAARIGEIGRAHV